MIILQAIIEGILSALLAGGILIALTNRYLPGLRESYLKKAAALSVLPLAAFSGIGHAVAVITNIPTVPYLPWLGLPVLAIATHRWIARWRRNRRVARKRLTHTPPGVNYPAYPAPIAAALRLLAPINQVDRLELVRLPIRLPNLHPDMVGYRIVFLTDFHVHPTLTDAFFEATVERALALHPDVIILGGDFVSRRRNCEKAAHVLARLAGFPRLIAVRGNHDFWTRPAFFRQMLHRWGAEILTNDVTILQRGAGRVALVGLEHPYVPLTPRRRHALLKQLETVAPKVPRLGVVHTPEAFAALRPFHCQFALAGHTHGGQIRLPFFGTTLAACTAPDEEIWGLGPRSFTSNGLGAFYPFRFLCPPQIVELTLQQESHP